MRGDKIPKERIHSVMDAASIEPTRATKSVRSERSPEDEKNRRARVAAAVSTGTTTRQSPARPLRTLPVRGSVSSSPSPLDLWSERSGVCVEVSSMGWDVSLHAGYLPKVRPKWLQRHRPNNVFAGLAGGLFADLRLKAHIMREEPMAR